MFIAMFTIAKTWMQPKCLSTDINRWFDKQDVAHKYDGILSACSVYLAIEKNEMLPF